METLKTMFGWAFSDVEDTIGYVKPDPRIIDGPFFYGDLKVTPLPVEHGGGGDDRVSVRVSGGAKRGLSAGCEADSRRTRRRLLMDVDVLVVDALRTWDHPTHFSLEEALEAAAAVRAEETWLTHLSHENDVDEIAKSLPPGVRVAWDGLRISLNRCAGSCMIRAAGHARRAMRFLVRMVFLLAAICRGLAARRSRRSRWRCFTIPRCRNRGNSRSFIATRAASRQENLIALDMPVTADISRASYEKSILKPLRAEFESRSWWKRQSDAAGVTLPVVNQIRVLVTMRGVPLRIQPTAETRAEAREIRRAGSAESGRRP